MNRDPRNTAHTPAEAVDWSEPSLEDTGRFRRMIDLHRSDEYEYLRACRGEQIEIETTAEGCEVTTDSTGPHPIITLECAEQDAEQARKLARLVLLRNFAAELRREGGK